jgi:hypothetical protein
VRRTGLCLIAATATLCLAAPAAASEQLGDTDVTGVTLQVNGRGEALVSYTRRTGAPRRVLVWGAVDARPPSRTTPQVRFSYDYSGGWRKYGRQVWQTFANRCRPYDGPALALLVAACKAPDGSYWALQSWQRVMPMRGVAPFAPRHGAVELHVSHWSGEPSVLEVSPNWTYGGRWQGLFGRLTHRGAPAHGFRTPTASRSDRYARFLYIDTLDSAFGSGWRRASAIVTHVGNGAFCYSFVPQSAPAGYPPGTPTTHGTGSRHRVTVMGAGVTPIVRWEGPALGRYDRAQDTVFDRLFDRLVGPQDRVCRAER